MDLLMHIYKGKRAKVAKITAWILANKNSNMRGVIPRCGLGLSSRLSISPSIVYVFPLPVCNIKTISMINSLRKTEGKNETKQAHPVVRIAEKSRKTQIFKQLRSFSHLMVKI